VRGPQRTPTKERITIRLSHDVVEQFRATGDGWQTRIDTALQEWLSARGHSATWCLPDLTPLPGSQTLGSRNFR